MALPFRLALRNVFANRRRTAIMLLAISFGAAALIVNGGLIYFIFNGLKEDAIYGRYGHIQIYRQGFSEHHQAAPLKYTLSNAEYEGLRDELKSVPQIEEITGRLDFSGLIVSGGKNVSFLGVGVEPQLDATFSRLVTIESGQGLSDSAPYGVLLGKGLAARAEVKPGDYVTVMTTTADGAYNALDLQVRGIFQGGWKEVDDWLMKVPLETAQRLMRFAHVDRVVLLLDKTASTDPVQGALQERFSSSGRSLEMTNWSDLALFYRQVVGMFSKELNIVKFIIAGVVVLSIINTVSLSVFERTREIGTVMAMGAKRAKILGIFLLEALVLGVAGGLLGVASGLVMAWVVSWIGIPMPPPPGSTLPFTAEVDVVPSILGFAFLISLISPLMATVYPAYRACRQPIVESLRHI